MGKLIYVDGIIKRLERVIQIGCRANDGEHPISAESVLSVIESLPAVDAVPVVHGRWKEDPSGYGFWICSACGFVSEASAADMLYKFCPVCGARMDGKDGDGNG